MNATHVTHDGTAVFEPSKDEYDAYMERLVHAATGLTIAQFHGAYEARELNETDPAVSDLVALLRISQNGHSPGT